MKYNIAIKGLGVSVPNKVVTNNDLLWFNNGCDSNWTETVLGIKERRWEDIEKGIDIMGTKAAELAIEHAGINKADIDLCIVSTSSPDFYSPSTACMIINNLGIKCPAFDINAVCSGFIYGLNVASSLIESNAYKTILLIASERYSKLTDVRSRDAVYFGDGAGAVILKKSENGGWISTEIHADGSGHDAFKTEVGYTFRMNGKAVFNTATTVLPNAINEHLRRHDLTINDISYLVPHQPGIGVLRKIADTINIPFEQVITVMDKYANTASASIPLALHKLLNERELNQNNLILLATVGSGWTWGVGIIKLDN